MTIYTGSAKFNASDVDVGTRTKILRLPELRRNLQIWLDEMKIDDGVVKSDLSLWLLWVVEARTQGSLMNTEQWLLQQVNSVC